jgi:hypothetical protein
LSAHAFDIVSRTATERIGMRYTLCTVLITGLLSGAALPASAQQDRTAGLVMGYPASVGVLWHVTEGVALRPDATISQQSIETTSTFTGLGGTSQTSTTTSDGWASSIGVSALFYLGAPDALRFYVTPRVAYAWSRTENEAAAGDLLQLGPYETESDGLLVAGSFGAQYAPHERFRLFGELGLSYSRQEGTTGYTVSRSQAVTTGVGLRSGVGVVVYF